MKVTKDHLKFSFDMLSTWGGYLNTTRYFRSYCVLILQCSLVPVSIINSAISKTSYFFMIVKEVKQEACHPSKPKVAHNRHGSYRNAMQSIQLSARRGSSMLPICSSCRCFFFHWAMWGCPEGVQAGDVLPTGTANQVLPVGLWVIWGDHGRLHQGGWY